MGANLLPPVAAGCQELGCIMPGGSRRHHVTAAVAAVLAEATLEAAAVRAGISRRTLTNWLRDERFQTRLRQATAQIEQHAIARLQAATTKAVAALERNLESGDPAAETRAAIAVLTRIFGRDDIGNPTVNVNVGVGIGVGIVLSREALARMAPAERERALENGARLAPDAIAALSDDELAVLQRAACRAKPLSAEPRRR